MSMMADQTRLVTGGVDTHKDAHVGAVVGPLGEVLGTRSFPNSGDGHVELLAWMSSHGPVARIGVEGTGSYGAGLSRRLRDEGLEVVEINRPDRTRRRRDGKSDPLDAIAAAHAAVSGRHAGTPKAGDGIVESIRMLRLCRRSAVQSRTQVANQMHALVDTAPVTWKDQWSGLTLDQLMTTITGLDSRGSLAGPDTAVVWTLQTLTTRWHVLSAEIDDIDTRLDELVAAAAPTLVELFGVGTYTAGALLVTAGDNPDRLRSEPAFASLCAVAPLPASSGRTTRHRLHRGGNRDANHALWRICIVRMAHHEPTKAYVQRRLAEGHTKREIIRCLKRYIAREIYPHLRHLADHN